MNIILKTVFLIFLALGPVSSVYAQKVDENLERRLELAHEMQDLRPVRAQVEAAIDQYILRISPAQRESYRVALRDILNYKALEKISVDAYAEVFTAEELEIMVDYYSKPEAQSASDKAGQYAAIVYPEIVRMLDKAMMKAKTGGSGP